MVYDTILVLAVLITGTALLLLTTKGQAIPPQNWFFQIYLLLLTFGFFIGFWAHGGQTVGMIAWRLKLTTHDGQPISTKRALYRSLFATPLLLLGGLGLFWSLWDKERLSLYDRLSKTRIICLF